VDADNGKSKKAKQVPDNGPLKAKRIGKRNYNFCLEEIFLRSLGC
jgi:hypothetical protein